MSRTGWDNQGSKDSKRSAGPRPLCLLPFPPCQEERIMLRERVKKVSCMKLSDSRGPCIRVLVGTRSRQQKTGDERQDPDLCSSSPLLLRPPYTPSARSAQRRLGWVRRCEWRAGRGEGNVRGRKRVGSDGGGWCAGVRSRSQWHRRASLGTGPREAPSGI